MSPEKVETGVRAGGAFQERERHWEVKARIPMRGWRTDSDIKGGLSAEAGSGKFLIKRS